MIRLRTFAAVTLERDGTPMTGRNTQRRRLALLVFLAAARRKPVSRDRLLGLLWPERDADRGRHALAQLIYELRRDLGQSVIINGGDDLLLDESCITSDVAEFEDAFQQGSMERVVNVYSGPFLDGFYVSDADEFERWAEERRRELAAKYLHALETLAVVATDRGRFSGAVEYRRRAAALDPLSARQALALMQALVRAGDRPAAIRHAQVYAELVRGELDVDADPSVTKLAAELSRPVVAPVAAQPEAPTQPSSVRHEEIGETLVTAPEPERSMPGAVPPSRRWMRARLPIAVISTAALVVGFAVLSGGLRFGTAPTPRRIVLGELASDDTVLSLAAREVIRAELERTPDVTVIGDAAVASTLGLMRLDAGTRLTETVADDVALRAGAPLVVVGRIATLGSSVEIVTRLLDPSRASPVAVLSAAPRGNKDVVAALSEMGKELRARVSRVHVENSPPLPAVTTSSLDALRDYALARAALARVDRATAITYAEAAVAQDSTFALAHYLLGDLLWYIDREHHAEEHLHRAFALSARLPARERLLVQARYAQLVLDRPDSALVFWRELRAAYPSDAQSYEGTVWADLAVGAYQDAATAADSALLLDSTSAPQVRNRMIALLGLRDTAGALKLTRSIGARWPYLEQQALMAAYLTRGDLGGLERLIDSIAPPIANGVPNKELAPTRQALLLALGRVREAANYESVITATLHAQFAIRAELFQARAELTLGEGFPALGRELLRSAITRLDSTDLSAPATSRLAELAASVAAVAADRSSIASLRAIIVARDGGRNLRSHALALLTIDAADAFARHEYDTSIRLLDRTRAQRFYGRSEGALALLEADALRLTRQRARADSLYKLVSTPGELRDDGDVWLSLRPIAIANMSLPAEARMAAR